MRTTYLSKTSLFFAVAVLVAAAGACGDDDDGSEADRRGVGAMCGTTEDCTEEGQQCLTQFTGGYCGVQDCASDLDCPDGSACVTGVDASDTANYCFLVCVDKIDCNLNRTVDAESNCVSSLTFIDGANGLKVCRPPYGG